MHLSIFERKKTPKIGEIINPCDTMHIVSHGSLLEDTQVNLRAQTLYIRNFTRMDIFVNKFLQINTNLRQNRH